MLVNVRIACDTGAMIATSPRKEARRITGTTLKETAGNGAATTNREVPSCNR